MIFWTKFAQKGYFQSKSEKINTTIELCILKSVYIPDFSLNWQFWFSGPNLPKKSISGQNWKRWTTYEFWIFEISKYQTSVSRIKFASKGYSQSKKWKVNSTHHWILHIQISLGTKFQLKLIILIFSTKFAQNGYFQSKSEKMNTAIKFCIFKSVYILNLSLNWQF